MIVGIGSLSNRNVIYNPIGTYSVHPAYHVVVAGESSFGQVNSNEGEFWVIEGGFKTITGNYSIVLDNHGERTNAVRLTHDGEEFYIIREDEDTAYMLSGDMRIDFSHVDNVIYRGPSAE